jgi:nicotinate dehydrogenase subunit A
MNDGLHLRVNEREYEIQVSGDTPLLYVLRDDLGFKAAKYGCGLEQCGACKVLLDGEAVYSCTLPVEAAVGRHVVTLEGLGTAERPHALQTAFIEANAGQCGYCVSGILIAAVALLRKHPAPGEALIREELSAHLCRCGSHPRYVRAVLRAAAQLSTCAETARGEP